MYHLTGAAVRSWIQEEVDGSPNCQSYSVQDGTMRNHDLNGRLEGKVLPSFHNNRRMPYFTSLLKAERPSVVRTQRK